MQNTKSSLYHYFGSLMVAITLGFFLFYLSYTLFSYSDATAFKIMTNPVIYISFILLVVVAPVWATVYFRRKKQADLQEYINVSTLRYITAFMMFFYGYAKIHQKFFDITYLTQDSKVSDLGSFELTWYYFGRSNVMEVMLGLLEFVPAIMLLFRRTTFLGAAIMLPVSLNVVMINVFNHISGLTFFVSIFVCIANIYIIYSYKDQVREFLAKVAATPRPAYGKGLGAARKVFKFIVIAPMVFIVCVTMFRKIKPSNSFAGRNKIKGGFELAELQVNHKPLKPENGNMKYYKDIYLEPQARWNTVLTFEPVFHPRAMTVTWSTKNDSVKTGLKKMNDVTQDAIDSATIFRGIYKMKGDSLLLIEGKQYGDTIKAVYHKKPLIDYTWFW